MRQILRCTSQDSEVMRKPEDNERLRTEIIPLKEIEKKLVSPRKHASPDNELQ